MQKLYLMHSQFRNTGSRLNPMLENNSSLMMKVWKAAFVFEREYGMPQSVFE